jgi:ribosome-associated protein
MRQESMVPLQLDALRPWIERRFGTSSGPGGQNVNKTSTAATLLFDFEACAALRPDERLRIRRLYAARLAHDGRLQVRSQRTRTQSGNVAAAERRLLELLEAARHVPKPRHTTRPTAGSQRRRLQAKRQRGAIKRQRGARPEE